MNYKRGISRKAIMAATVKRATIMEIYFVAFLLNMAFYRLILRQNGILLKTVQAALVFPAPNV